MLGVFIVGDPLPGPEVVQKLSDLLAEGARLLGCDTPKVTTRRDRADAPLVIEVASPWPMPELRPRWEPEGGS